MAGAIFFFHHNLFKVYAILNRVGDSLMSAGKNIL